MSDNNITNQLLSTFELAMEGAKFNPTAAQISFDDDNWMKPQDQNKINRFWEIVQLLADVTFGRDTSYDSAVEVHLTDRSRFEKNPYVNIPYEHKAKSQRERMEIMDLVFLNSSIGTNALDKAWRLLQMEHRDKPKEVAYETRHTKPEILEKVKGVVLAAINKAKENPKYQGVQFVMDTDDDEYPFIRAYKEKKLVGTVRPDSLATLIEKAIECSPIEAVDFTKMIGKSPETMTTGVKLTERREGGFKVELV